MSNLKIAYVINDAAFFVSHRLPLALEVQKLGGHVCLITGHNVNEKLENGECLHGFVEELDITKKFDIISINNIQDLEQLKKL